MIEQGRQLQQYIQKQYFQFLTKKKEIYGKVKTAFSIKRLTEHIVN